MMNAEIGQIQIGFSGKDYFFNPSLLAMTRIGAPGEIIDHYVKVHGGHYPQNPPLNAMLMKIINSPVYGRAMLSSALIIMQACSDDDVTLLAGEFRFNAAKKQIYKPGAMSTQQIIIFAQHLIHHGVTGDNAIQSTGKGGEYSAQFDARALVYSLVAHLGLCENEAWGMTMTAVNYLMQAKYPELNKPKIPSQDDYEKAMAWADAVMAMDV
jgi:hypothetical protein